MIVIVIDSVAIKGEARIVKNGVAAIEGITNDVVVRLAAGRNAAVEIGLDGATWNISLDGFGEALTETVKAYAKS